MATLWSEKHQQNWQVVRSEGYRRYLMKTALPWAILMFVANAVIQWFLYASADGQPWIFLLINLVVWSLGGWLFGHLLWRYGQYQFRTFPSRNNTTKATTATTEQDKDHDQAS